MARRTPAQRAETRQNIILAARALFAEKGFANTQVSEIALGAGVGISAFYGQFNDKEALFVHIAEAMFTDLHMGVIAVRRSMDLNSPLDALLTMQRLYTLIFETLARNHDITLSVMRSGFAAVPHVEALFWSICDAVASAMSLDLTRSEKAGRLRLENHRDFADATVGMILHLAHRMALQGTPTAHDAAKICTKMTLGGLLLSMPSAAMTQILPLLTPLTPEMA